jgi:hypothetical protein
MKEARITAITIEARTLLDLLFKAFIFSVVSVSDVPNTRELQPERV